MNRITAKKRTDLHYIVDHIVDPNHPPPPPHPTKRKKSIRDMHRQSHRILSNSIKINRSFSESQMINRCQRLFPTQLQFLLLVFVISDVSFMNYIFHLTLAAIALVSKSFKGNVCWVIAHVLCLLLKLFCLLFSAGSIFSYVDAHNPW